MAFKLVDTAFALKDFLEDFLSSDSIFWVA
jgi:hypothetical protein